MFGRKVNKEDFELVGVIGQGSFAKVVQVKAKFGDQATYAMKVLKKKTVMDRGDHRISSLLPVFATPRATTPR